jgi:Holliday junction DNA helicase RuvA
MIASIAGEINEITNDSLVIVLGGLGLRVFVPSPLRNRLRVGEHASLTTYLVVREDALSLYGFDNAEERDFFVLLLGVNGVGPRIALACLSVLTTDAIRRAVVSEQSEIFARVPGVGKKTAQKILLHLQGRIQGGESISGFGISVSEVDTEVLSALTSLGYSVIEGQTAIQAIPKDAPSDIESRLRLALQYFSR